VKSASNRAQHDPPRTRRVAVLQLDRPLRVGAKAAPNLVALDRREPTSWGGSLLSPSRQAGRLSVGPCAPVMASAPGRNRLSGSRRPPVASTRRALLALPQGPSLLRRGNVSRPQAGQRWLSPVSGSCPRCSLRASTTCQSATRRRGLGAAPSGGVTPSPLGRVTSSQGPQSAEVVLPPPRPIRTDMTIGASRCLLAGRSDPQVRGDGKRQLYRSQDHGRHPDGRWRARIATQTVPLGLRRLPRHPARSWAPRLNRGGSRPMPRLSVRQAVMLDVLDVARL
jgi:hypothetical protein